MIRPKSSASRVIATRAQSRSTWISSKTVDLCFLAGLYLRANKTSLASFEEDALVDLFEQVCDVVADSPTVASKEADSPLQSVHCSQEGHLHDPRQVIAQVGVEVQQHSDGPVEEAAVPETFDADGHGRRSASVFRLNETA